jgi:tRNA pseudouridine38-40 synthase
VQQLLEEALSVLLQCEIAVVGCGRTDAGVNAGKYFAHFDIAAEGSAASCAVEDFVAENDNGFVKRVAGEGVAVAEGIMASDTACAAVACFARAFGVTDKGRFLYRLNAILPKEIVVYDIYEVKPDMHARFSAISRSYKYYVHTEKNPFIDKYSYLIHFSPDMEAINTACKYLLTQSDFTSFAKLHSDNKNNLCTLTEAKIENFEDNRFVFTFTANRFLRNMVRAMVGTLLELGCGKISQEQLRNIIEAKDRSAAGVSVPAKALFLVDVRY